MSHHPLNTPIGRFGIDTVAEGDTTCVATMPLDDMVNPVTGAPSLAALAMLLDHVGGVVNHYRRGVDEWTVSSELALELGPDAIDVLAAASRTGAVTVTGEARPFGPKTATALAEAVFRIGDVPVATGTVRSFYIEAPATFAESPVDPGALEARTGLAAKLTVGAARTGDGAVVLPQLPDRVLENSIGVVHGGVASAGLEVVGAAAVDAGGALRTASLRVNFLRQFFAGDESRYVGTPLRIGRRTGVADAAAIGADGRVAITARVTAYRC